MWPAIIEFLRQSHKENVNADQSMIELRELFNAEPSVPEADAAVESD